MLRVALSLKQRTAPAHVIVQRLTNSFPADRLAKAFTNLGGSVAKLLFRGFGSL
jgi:Tn3 transposase DDE domain-containing protein